MVVVGDVVTHPSGARPPAGTLSQGCVPMPCPSLPASPTLSPALSTWHAWARGGLAPFPSFMGSKGQAEGWQAGTASPPSLLGTLARGRAPLAGPQHHGGGAAFPASR